MPHADIVTLPAADQAAVSFRVAARSAVPSRAEPFRVECFDAMAPLEAEWRALERDDLTSLHQSYDWCAAWVATHRRPLAVLRGMLDGRTAFILPLEIIGGALASRAEFIGAAHSNINTGLFAKEFLSQRGDLLARLRPLLIEALRGRADLLVLRNVPFGWRGGTSPLASLPAIENQNHAFQLPLLGSMEKTIAQVNAKRRRKKFRQQSRIIDEAGGYEHIIPGTLEEQRALLDLFFRQKAERFCAAGLPDVFRDEAVRAFLHGLLSSRDDANTYAALVMHGLRLKGEHEGHIAAIAGLSRKGDHVICQFASIDESLVARASPGELLFWLMIERVQAQGAALFDFGIGDQCYKRAWCPVETIQHDVVLPISLPGRAAAIAARGATYAKGVIKANARLYQLLQTLRAGHARRPVEDEAD